MTKPVVDKGSRQKILNVLKAVFFVRESIFCLVMGNLLTNQKNESKDI